MAKIYNSVLVISDLHAPFYHPDAIAFLKALNDKYKFDKIISIGDEVDYHAISFHASDPDLLSPSDELKSAILKLQPLYRLFPKVSLIDSNHGSLVYRKGKFHGLPRSVFKSYREVLQAPKGWHWSFDLTINVTGNKKVYLHHGKSKAPAKLSKNFSISTIEGHFHSEFNIHYWANPNGLYFAMKTGCLIDDKSLAFSYNLTTLDRPIIGCCGVIDGQPKLFPLIKNHYGRWTGFVP